MSVQAFGPHKVTNASLDSPVVDAMLAGERVDILYSDPPWGDAYLRMFQTHAFKATGRRPAQINHAQLCARLADLVRRYVDRYVFIETSTKCAGEVMDHLSGVVRELRSQPTLYDKGLKAVLIVGAKGDAPMPPEQDMRGVKGLAFVVKALAPVARPGATVLDPCCGAGYTARAAMRLGMAFRGNELNPARLAKTIGYLKGQ